MKRDAPTVSSSTKAVSEVSSGYITESGIESRKEAEYIQKDRTRHDIPSLNDVFTIRLYASVGLEAQCFVERMLISDAYSSHLSFSVPHFLLLVPAHQSAP